MLVFFAIDGIRKVIRGYELPDKINCWKHKKT